MPLEGRVWIIATVSIYGWKSSKKAPQDFHSNNPPSLFGVSESSEYNGIKLNNRVTLRITLTSLSEIFR